MNQQSTQSGFSAVELLITLIIASLFIIMGFQLYSVSLENGGEARREAAASAIAYKKLRQMSSAGTTGMMASCPTTEPFAAESTVEVDNNKADQTTTVTCPQPTEFPKLRLATVKVKYKVSETEISHAMYITEN